MAVVMAANCLVITCWRFWLVYQNRKRDKLVQSMGLTAEEAERKGQELGARDATDVENPFFRWVCGGSADVDTLHKPLVESFAIWYKAHVKEDLLERLEMVIILPVHGLISESTPCSPRRETASNPGRSGRSPVPRALLLCCSSPIAPSPRLSSFVFPRPRLSVRPAWGRHN